jgi:predicted nucleic acid-binding Zn finger protein
MMIPAVAYIAYKAPRSSSGTDRCAELLKAHTYSVFLYVGNFLQTDYSLSKGVAHVCYEFVSSLFSIQSGTKFNFH